MTLTGIPAVDWLVVVAVGITALGVIWRKALRPMIQAAERAQETLPVVLSIASEFQANGGSSLRDTIESIARTSAEELGVLSAYAHGFRHEFVNRFAVLEGNQELLKGEVAKVQAELAEVKKIVDRRLKPR